MSVCTLESVVLFGGWLLGGLPLHSLDSVRVLSMRAIPGRNIRDRSTEHASQSRLTKKVWRFLSSTHQFWPIHIGQALCVRGNFPFWLVETRKARGTFGFLTNQALQPFGVDVVVVGLACHGHRRRRPTRIREARRAMKQHNNEME